MKRWSRVLLLLFLATVIGGVTAIGQNQFTGIVNYHGNDELPMQDVIVNIYDFQNVLITSTQTNENGLFTFEDLPDGEFFIRSTSNHEPEGIDLEDAQQVLLYLLGHTQLTQIQLEAADVNNSGDVSWYDYFYIVYNYLINGQAFPAGDWQFEEAYINLSSRESGDTTSLWGTAEGEVELDWQTSGRSIENNKSHFDKYVIDNNNETQVNITTDYPGWISGFSIELAYPENELMIIDIEGPDENLNYSIDDQNGTIKLNWLNENSGLNSSINGDRLITLTIKSSNNDSKESAFTLLSDVSVIDINGDKIDNLDVGLPILLKTSPTEYTFEAVAYPNPVVDQINFNLTLPQANYGSVYIYDLSGRLVNQMENLSFQEGSQVISVNTQHFMPGHYFYVLDLGVDNIHKVKGRFFKSE